MFCDIKVHQLFFFRSQDTDYTHNPNVIIIMFEKR